MNEWFSAGRASAIVGGQFGSEAKGLAAAYMARRFRHELKNCGGVISTTNAGAQAGHTTKYADGIEWVCYHLPTTHLALNKDGECNFINTAYVNSGAIIDPDLLRKELASNKYTTDLVIHPHAAWIRNEEKRVEESAHDGVLRIASTSKGVGAALARKISRKVDSVIQDCGAIYDRGVIEQMDLFKALRRNYSVIVEIPQGTGLSIGTSGFFPYTTSRECWVNQGLTDAGINARMLGPTLMVMRTYPIRVGNTVGNDGRVNSSGPFFSDGPEIMWEELQGRAVPELTTVTKRVRRIAKFSFNQYERSLALNLPTWVMLTFVNYLSSAKELGVLNTKMLQTETKVRCFPNKIFSWGPNVEDCGTLTQAAAWLMDRDRITVYGAGAPDTAVAATSPPPAPLSGGAGSMVAGPPTPASESLGEARDD